MTAKVFQYKNNIINSKFFYDLYFDNIDKGVQNDWIGPVEGQFYEQSLRSYQDYLVNLFKLVVRESEIISRLVVQAMSGNDYFDVEIFFDRPDGQHKDEKEFFLVGKEVDPEILDFLKSRLCQKEDEGDSQEGGEEEMK